MNPETFAVRERRGRERRGERGEREGGTERDRKGEREGGVEKGGDRGERER